VIYSLQIVVLGFMISILIII